MSATVEMTEVVKNDPPKQPDEACTPCENESCHCSEHAGADHLLDANCDHQLVEHNGHYDLVMNGSLHHPHNDHFDYHGAYDPSVNKSVNIYTKSIRKLVSDALGNESFGVRHYEHEEPGNVKRQYNLTDEEKEKFSELNKKKLQRMKSEQCRLLCMMTLTGGFMLVEFFGGIIAGALALQADAMHMASDLIALIVGYSAISLSKRPESGSNTYGWSRFEVVGAMVNAVFLMAVCLNIVVEALTRFFDIGEVQESMNENRRMYLIVAVIGLFVNVLGLFFLGCGGDDDGHGHGHAHGHAHGHDHGHHREEEEEEDHDHDEEEGHDHEHEHGHEHEHADHEHEEGHKHDEHEHDHDEHGEHEHAHDSSEVVVNMEKPKKKKKRSSNLQAVLLHVAGDALGSVAAILSACFVNFFPDDATWKYYADPICSLLIVILILRGAVPLFKSVLNILLQAAPRGLNVQKLREAILHVNDVTSVHGLHIWQLNEDVTVGSVHVICKRDCNHQRVMDDVKRIFHKNNIHTSCVQVEVVRENGPIDVCNDIVCGNKNCLALHCCAPGRLGRELATKESENHLAKASSI